MTDLNVFLFIMNICVIMFCSALLPIIPLLTRKSFLFGVKVPPEVQNTDEVKALKKNYVISMIIGVIVVLAASIWQYVTAPNYTIFSVLYLPLALVAIQMFAFVPNHSKTMALKERLGWNVPEIVFADTKETFTRGNLSAMPHFWYVISLLLVLVLFVIALVRYPALPDSIPTHWGVNAQPDIWKDKNPGVVLFMPLFSLGMVVLMWLCGILIERAKLQIDHNEPVKSFAQHKKYRRLMGHGIGAMTVSVVVTFAITFMQSLFVGFNAPLLLLLAPVLVVTVLLCVVAVRAGQGGVFLKVEVPNTPVDSGNIAANNAMSDDKYWAWGLFYHNPNDPAYFVGNRFGINIGFNFSRLPVKIGLAVCFVLLVGTYVWMTILFASYM
ncbi:MAG: DUF1648 domain-containing protein [Firmicutes bacterium]|nr:DUF1648 domain-containing protein [Bacillota bacterium]